MPRVSEEYKEEKRQEILDAALRVCKRKTLLAITMQDIIDESGQSQGNIYRYYSDLDEIIAKLLSRQRNQAKVIPEFDRIFEANEDFMTTLDKIMVLLGEFMEAGMESYSKLDFEFNAMSMHFPERAERILSMVNQESESNLGYLMKKAMEKFKVAPEKMVLSPKELMMLIGTAYSGIQMNALLSYTGNPMLPWKEYRPKKQMKLLAKTIKRLRITD